MSKSAFSFGAAAFKDDALNPAASTPPPQQAPAARPAQPGAPNVAVQPQNPAEPAAPQTGVDFGGSNDPAMNAWLNQQGAALMYPRHPKSGHYLTGPFKNQTPGQAREKLITDYRAGRRGGVNAGAGPGGGLKTGTMTGQNPFTPDDVWKNMTKPGQIARPASTMAPRGADALSPASAAAPAMTATNPAAAVMATAAKAAVQPVKPSSPAVTDKELIAQR